MREIEADYDQVHLLPPSIEDWVDDAHPARFVRCFVEGLDLGAMGVATRGVGARGRPGFAPALLLRVWLYAYFKKVRSTRKVEAACREDIGFIWLCGGHVPDHNTLWRFWEANRAALRELFAASVLTSCRMGLVGLAVGALDGTKIQAAAHAGKAYDAADLEARAARLAAEIGELEAQIEEAGAGGGGAPPELPARLRGKRRLAHAVELARAELARAGVKHVHPLEPEARRVKTRGGKPFGYNAQATADSEHQIITAAAVTSDANDQRQLGAMLDQAQENLRPHREGAGGGAATTTLADRGYANAEAIGHAERDGHEVLMPLNARSETGRDGEYHASKFEYEEARDVVRCPAGRELPFVRERLKDGKPVRVYRGAAATCRACPAFGLCTRDRHGRTIDVSPWHAAVERQREKMADPANATLFKRRGAIIEPVFAQIKGNGGFWRWSFKGLKKVNAQWWMLCTAWNLQVMYRNWVAARNARGATALAA